MRRAGGGVRGLAAARAGLPLAWEERAWSALHRLLAAPVCAQLVALRSVFVKFGQYVGGRPDIIPPEWATELKQLQACGWRMACAPQS